MTLWENIDVEAMENRHPYKCDANVSWANLVLDFSSQKFTTLKLWNCSSFFSLLDKSINFSRNRGILGQIQT